MSDKMDNSGFWDFKKHTVNGKTYYSYHAPDDNFAELMMNGYNPGMRVILDEKYNKVKTLHLSAAGDYVRNGDPVDGHDFFMFDLNHYILSSYIKRFVPEHQIPSGVNHSEGGCYVAAAYLQEVQGGKVIFDWWSTDYPELMTYGDSAFASDGVFDFMNTTDQRPDYVHFNAIQVLDDGNWFCSFRHISTLLKIDRKSGTGNIIWRLSGSGDDFSMPESEKTHGQHYARLQQDGTVTLFDNGNGNNVSKVVQFKINEGARTISDYADYSSGDYFSTACGSHILVGTSHIVGWGVPGGTNETNRILSEIDVPGQETFSLKFLQNQMENTFFATYRCVKY